MQCWIEPFRFSFLPISHRTRVCKKEMGLQVLSNLFVLNIACRYLRLEYQEVVNGSKQFKGENYQNFVHNPFGETIYCF